MIIWDVRFANIMTKSYRSRTKKGPYLTRSFRIPLWASVTVDQHADRNFSGNASQALERIIDDWRAHKRMMKEHGVEIEALIRFKERGGD